MIELLLTPQSSRRQFLQYLKDNVDRDTTRVGPSTVKSTPGPTIVTNWNVYWGQKASVDSISLYAQNTWKFAFGWEAVTGVRRI